MTNATLAASRRPDAFHPLTLLKAGVDAADVVWVRTIPAANRRAALAVTFRGQTIVQKVWQHVCAPRGQTVGANPVPA